MSEFTEGQYVIYHNESTDHYELGRIKTLTEDGAFVAYHSGETGAKTPYDLMHPLVNEYVIEKTLLGGSYFDSAEPGREECEEREQGLCPFYAG